MTLIRKLRLVVFALLVILVLFITKIFTLSKNKISAQNNPPTAGLKEGLVGNFSRSLASVQEKNLTIYWDNPVSGSQEQKNIPLEDITSTHLRQYTGKQESIINFEKLDKVLEELDNKIKKDPINARLEYDSINKRIREFSLPQNGRRLNIQKTAANIASHLSKAQLNSPAILDEIIPLINKNSLEKLGITAFLAKGESDFKGSTVNRVHNITLGASKFQGLLLKPGEEFSFNTCLCSLPRANL